jgi:hypothetical protein
MKAVYEEVRQWEKNNLILVYGEEILALSENDEQLLAQMESNAPELQKMALCALSIRHILHTRIIEICARYLVSGERTDIRSLCLEYLLEGRGRGHDDLILDVLRSCARRINGSKISRDDAMISRHVGWVIRHFESPGRAAQEREDEESAFDLDA